MDDCSPDRSHLCQITVKRKGKKQSASDRARTRKSSKGDTQTADLLPSYDHTWPHPSHSALLYVPSCSEARLSTRCADMLRRLNWDQKWMGLLPARIGYDRSLDLAVSALLEAQRSIVAPIGTAKADSIRLYLDAIDSVQAVLNVKSFWTSEQAQLAIGVLARYESTKGASLNQAFTHKQGLLTLLVRNEQATEVLRAMVYDEMIVAFIVYCTQGIPSKFDAPFWLDLNPTPSLAPTVPIASLRKIAFRLFILLPGLAVLVRKLRNYSNTSDGNSTLMYAVALAQRCIAERNDRAEDLLLHSVKVSKPRGVDLQNIVWITMRFGSLIEFEAAVFYWQARILLNRLLSALQQLCPEQRYFDEDKINAENCRLAKNLLMSWESVLDFGLYGMEQGGAGTMAFFAAMIAIWGVLGDVDTFQGRSCEVVAAWVLQRMQILRKRGMLITAEHMDEMADLLAGGPIKGILVFVVGQANR